MTGASRAYSFILMILEVGTEFDLYSFFIGARAHQSFLFILLRSCAETSLQYCQSFAFNGMVRLFQVWMIMRSVTCDVPWLSSFEAEELTIYHTVSKKQSTLENSIPAISDGNPAAYRA